MKCFKKYACAFKNEAECWEELQDDEGKTFEEAEDEYFDD